MFFAAGWNLGLGRRIKMRERSLERRGLETWVLAVETLSTGGVHWEEHSASNQQREHDRFHGLASRAR